MLQVQVLSIAIFKGAIYGIYLRNNICYCISYTIRQYKHGVKLMKPDFFVRLDDFEIFSKNEDGLTYSNHISKTDFPENQHHMYPESNLVNEKFFPFFGSYAQLIEAINLKTERKNRPDGDFSEFTILSNVADRVTNLEEKVKVLENKNTTWTVEPSQAKQSNDRE